MPQVYRNGRLIEEVDDLPDSDKERANAMRKWHRAQHRGATAVTRASSIGQLPMGVLPRKAKRKLQI